MCFPLSMIETIIFSILNMEVLSLFDFLIGSLTSTYKILGTTADFENYEEPFLTFRS